MGFLKFFKKKTFGTYGLLLCMLISCTNLNSEIVLKDLSAEEIYSKAQKEFDFGDKVKAAELFLEIERIYPYSGLAKRALLMNAVALLEEKDYEASRVSAARFIRFYPADEDTPYAYYLIALSYYDQIDDLNNSNLYVVSMCNSKITHKLIKVN